MLVKGGYYSLPALLPVTNDCLGSSTVVSTDVQNLVMYLLSNLLPVHDPLPPLPTALVGNTPYPHRRRTASLRAAISYGWRAKTKYPLANHSA